MLVPKINEIPKLESHSYPWFFTVPNFKIPTNLYRYFQSLLWRQLSASCGTDISLISVTSNYQAAIFLLAINFTKSWFIEEQQSIESCPIHSKYYITQTDTYIFFEYNLYLLDPKNAKNSNESVLGLFASNKGRPLLTLTKAAGLSFFFSQIKKALFFND